LIAGCGPPDALREMHVAYNTGKWAVVTEKFADMGRPQTLDAVSYARIAEAAGRVYAESKSPAYRDLAIQCYDLAALADEYLCEKGDLLLRAAEGNQALTAYRDALHVNPRNAPAVVQAARLLLDSGRPAEAAGMGRGLLAAGAPVDGMLLYGLLVVARAEAVQKHGDAALKILRHARVTGPAACEPDILYALAECHDAMGENGPARSALRRALALLPDDPKRRGPFEKYLERLEGASRSSARAAPTVPPPTGSPPTISTGMAPTLPPPGPPPSGQPPRQDDATAKATNMVAQAMALADEGKVDEAIKLLEEAVRLAPKLPAAAAQLAALQVKAGDIAGARKTLEAAVQNMPDNEILREMLDRLKAEAAPASQPGG
jgi:tetratricopeptide (TPR) repeat protein